MYGFELDYRHIFYWSTHSVQHCGTLHTTPNVSVPESPEISIGQSTTKTLKTSSRKLHISSATRSSSLFASSRMVSKETRKVAREEEIEFLSDLKFCTNIF